MRVSRRARTRVEHAGASHARYRAAHVRQVRTIMAAASAIALAVRHAPAVAHEAGASCLRGPVLRGGIGNVGVGHALLHRRALGSGLARARARHRRRIPLRFDKVREGSVRLSARARVPCFFFGVRHIGDPEYPIAFGAEACNK
jgi:hypothetical protein